MVNDQMCVDAPNTCLIPQQITPTPTRRRRIHDIYDRKHLVSVMHTATSQRRVGLILIILHRRSLNCHICHAIQPFVSANELHAWRLPPSEAFLFAALISHRKCIVAASAAALRLLDSLASASSMIISSWLISMFTFPWSSWQFSFCKDLAKP